MIQFTGLLPPRRPQPEKSPGTTTKPLSSSAKSPVYTRQKLAFTALIESTHGTRRIKVAPSSPIVSRINGIVRS
jgi:hypothetical protein